MLIILLYSDGPYPHSKRIIDLLSVDINNRLNHYGVYSDTVCPGMVVSQMTTVVMPVFVWYLILPIILMVFMTFLIIVDNVLFVD